MAHPVAVDVDALEALLAPLVARLGAEALDEHARRAERRAASSLVRFPHAERRPGQLAIETAVDCGVCHAGPIAEYESGIHGRLAMQGDEDAPTCLDCHEKHAEQDRTTPTSPTFPRNVPNLCAKCHRVGEQAAVRIVSGVEHPVESYDLSIHGKGLMKSGLVVTATCVNCHSAHGELPPDDPDSTIHPDNVAETCGTCHYGKKQEFINSIHWPGVGTADAEELPTCADCHTSHTISRVDQGDFRTLMTDQCGRCHETEAETYFDTFHGKVSRLGAEGVAKCSDCHGTHDILPVSNADSALSRENVVGTCGQCHEGSHRQFAGYLTHATHHDVDRRGLCQGFAIKVRDVGSTHDHGQVGRKGAYETRNRLPLRVEVRKSDRQPDGSGARGPQCTGDRSSDRPVCRGVVVVTVDEICQGKHLGSDAVGP